VLELDQFIADCRAAITEDKSQKFVREVVMRALSDPPAVLKALGEPTRGVLQTLYRSDDLTILNIVWAPYMTLMPHNHNMWGIIGIYNRT
jgi:predicted metal-dependent enzyme (double-stranded beta helix superfamily)